SPHPGEEHAAGGRGDHRRSAGDGARGCKRSMNATTALAARRSDSLTLRVVLEAWRGITREQVVTTMLLGFALHVYRIVVTIDIRVAPFILVGDQLKA